MNSCIYTAKLGHERLRPVQNKFRYSIYMFYFDLDEIEGLADKLFFFSYNKWNIYSFWDKDHFKFINNYKGDTKTISQEKIKYDQDRYKNKNTRQRIETMIKEMGLEFELGKVFILTNLRTLGYVFNPVSFYYCFDKAGKLRVLFSEVNNTFLDQKMYYSQINDPDKDVFKEKQRKNYYISPFISYDSELQWTFRVPGEKLSMMIDSIKDNEAILKTNLVGLRQELSNLKLIYLLLRYPLYNIMVIVLIHFQAMKLWLKKVPFHKKGETDKKIAEDILSNKEQ